MWAKASFARNKKPEQLEGENPSVVALLERELYRTYVQYTFTAHSLYDRSHFA